MSRFKTAALVASTLVLNGAGWLAAIWFGWKAVTLGLIPANPARFVMYGAVAWVASCAARLHLDINLNGREVR